MYSDDKKNYGDVEYEVLNDKLNIFYENCSRLGIDQGDDVEPREELSPSF